MIGSNEHCRLNIRRNRKAASPAISMVIMVAATVVLVMVSSSFALQALERQQAAAEFDTVQKSVLAFDDAVRDIAWDLGGSRSVRFTTHYGNMRLVSSSKSFSISMPGVSEPYEFTTSVVKYYMPFSYFTLGNEYSAYILGSSSTVVSSVTDSFGQVLVKQEKGFASIALNYRVRVSRQGPSTYVETMQQSINYVDILVIRLNCLNVTIGSGDFDLVAKNIGITTDSYPADLATAGAISVVSDEVSASVILEAGHYMFNLIIADVQVSY